MNKKDLRVLIIRKRDKRLEELKENYEKWEQEREKVVIQEKVGTELQVYNSAKTKLIRSSAYSLFVKALSELEDKMEESTMLRSNDNYYRRHMFRYLMSKDLDYEVVVRSGGTHNADDILTKMYVEYEEMLDAVRLEYDKLLAYLKSTTAKKFVEHMSELGFDLGQERVEELQLPAPVFDMRLLK